MSFKSGVKGLDLVKTCTTVSYIVL